ncbi:MAG: serine hydrolase domain-containing protein [Pseudomonadota bacterium]
MSEAALLIGSMIVSTVALTAAAPAFAELPSEALVRHIDNHIDSGNYVGVIVGFVDGDDVYVQAFGTTTKGARTPPNEHTIFEISSLSKTFAATLLAQAVVGKRLDLREPANRYLASDSQLTAYKNQEITLLDLAAHQSGLPYMPADIVQGEAPNPYAKTAAAALRTSINAFTPTSSPGQGYSYSAFAYGVLALILETTGNQDFATLVRRDVTAPLGMTDTVMTLDDKQHDRLATGYTPEGEVAQPLDQGVFRAAGSMYSTLHDLMIWLRANMEPQASPFSDSLTLAHTVQNDLGTIGLAWHKTEGFDDRSQYGTAHGYRAYVGFLADGSKGAVLLANTKVDVAALGSHLLLGTDLPD